MSTPDTASEPTDREKPQPSDVEALVPVALAGEASADRSDEAERAFRASLERETLNFEAPAAMPAATAGSGGLSDVRQRLSAALARVKGAARQT